MRYTNGVRAAFRILFSLFVAIVPSFSCQGRQRSVALTFDDLPIAGTNDPAIAQSVNGRILDALERHHAPAVGFVIGRGAQELGDVGTAILTAWGKRGQMLGNHTFSHNVSDALTTEQFQKDIEGGGVSLAAVLPKTYSGSRYFRFPQNHTGDTKEKHDAIAAFLTERGYRVAPCTIDNEDFVFNSAYLKMLPNRDGASATKLRAAYLAYTAVEIDYYAGLHKQIFGREPPQVMLLHVNQLNADVIDKLIDLFKSRHYRFVTLDMALNDAAYKTPDIFIVKFAKSGPMWGYRWAEALHVRVNGSLEAEPPEWVIEYQTKQK